MKILDRYIARQYVINFAILLTIFLALFLVVDLIMDLDEFLDAGKTHAQTRGGVFWATLWAIVDYYGPTLVFLYVFFSGLVAVGAMGFTFSALSRSGELVAITTCGVSAARTAAPVVVIACALNMLTLPLQEWVIPRYAHKLVRSKSQVKYSTIKAFQVEFALDQRQNLLCAAEFKTDTPEPVLTGVTILERDAGGKAVRRIMAEQAFWDDQRGGWELVGGVGISAAAVGDDGLEAPAAAHREEVGFYRTNLSPMVLLGRRATIYPVLLSFAELREMSAFLAPDDGAIRRIMHGRFSLVVMNVLVLVMGLPFFLVPRPTSLLRQGIIASGVCMSAWGTGLMLMHVGFAGLNPVLAAWLPVVLFLPVSAVMLAFWL